MNKRDLCTLWVRPAYESGKISVDREFNASPMQSLSPLANCNAGPMQSLISDSPVWSLSPVTAHAVKPPTKAPCCLSK